MISHNMLLEKKTQKIRVTFLLIYFYYNPVYHNCNKMNRQNLAFDYSSFYHYIWLAQAVPCGAYFDCREACVLFARPANDKSNSLSLAWETVRSKDGTIANSAQPLCQRSQARTPDYTFFFRLLSVLCS